MIISHKHKFIFIKTKKVGGSSLEHSLLPYLGPEDIYTGYPNELPSKNIDPTIDTHIGHDWIRENFPQEWDSYFKFTVERNSFDKMVSFYYHFKKFKPQKVKAGFNFFIKKFGKEACDWNLYATDKILVDKVLRYENLHQELMNTPEIPYNGGMLEIFKLSGFRETSNYKDMYDEESVSLVQDVFLREIKTFNYSF